MSVVLLVAAVVLALWSAAVSADYASWGTPAVLSALALAAFAASFLPSRR